MLVFQGPTWKKSRDGSVLPASWRYDGSRSRKTKGSLADTLQCNIWQRAQTPNKMTHCMHGGNNHGSCSGFTSLSKYIGTSQSSQTDSDYVKEHSILKYFRTKCKPDITNAYRCDRSTPSWRETGESGTKQLYQPEPKPVVYIVPITSILGRLPLIPVGDHGTIPAAMSNRKRELFEYGKCDEVGHPGNGSKLY